MSQADVERYLRAFAAFERGDFEAWLRDAPDEWHTTATFPGVEPVYKARDGMRALWEFMRGPWEMHSVIERIEDVDGTVLVLLTTPVKGGSSGAEAQFKAGHVATNEDGYVRLRNYLTWEDALAAVGLPE